MKRYIFIASVALLFSSCHKKDDTDTKPNVITPTPIDSPVVYHPYSVGYVGTLHNKDYHDDPLGSSIDTTYVAKIMVSYPDTSLIRFELAFWDAINIGHTSRPDDSIYFNHQTYTYERNQLNSYQDSIRHHKTKFILRSDSLLITKSDAGGTSWLQYVTFAGKKQ